MATCEQLRQQIARVSAQIAQLERQHSGQHGEQLQALLDQKDELETEYDQQGCFEPPPPPSPGQVVTRVMGPSLAIPRGSTGTITLQITSISGPDASAEYYLDPPMPDFAAGLMVAVPRGATVSASLPVTVLGDAPLGEQPLHLVESVYFGGFHDAQHQQFDTIAPAPTVVVLPDPAPVPVPARTCFDPSSPAPASVATTSPPPRLPH